MLKKCCCTTDGPCNIPHHIWKIESIKAEIFAESGARHKYKNLNDNRLTFNEMFNKAWERHCNFVIVLEDILMNMLCLPGGRIIKNLVLSPEDIVEDLEEKARFCKRRGGTLIVALHKRTCQTPQEGKLLKELKERIKTSAVLYWDLDITSGDMRDQWHQKNSNVKSRLSHLIRLCANGQIYEKCLKGNAVHVKCFYKKLNSV